MPGTDGFDVVEQLRADPPTADIPVIVLTAKTIDEADRERLNSQRPTWPRRVASPGPSSWSWCGAAAARRWRDRGDEVAGELILIVEDNDKNLKLARDVLQYHGFRTLEATTAADGIALAVEHQPDLVLMDIQLPDMDGVSALQQLRTEPRRRPFPVVALTAFAMEADRSGWSAAGFDGYLAKPIDVHDFPDQVRRYCERR